MMHMIHIYMKMITSIICQHYIMLITVIQFHRSRYLVPKLSEVNSKTKIYQKRPQTLADALFSVRLPTFFFFDQHQFPQSGVLHRRPKWIRLKVSLNQHRRIPRIVFVSLALVQFLDLMETVGLS